MKRTLLAAIVASAFAATAADTLAPGKYSGNYEIQSRTGPVTASVVVDIKEVTKDKVTATSTVNGTGGCDGDVPMEGKFTKGTLSLKSTQKYGRAGDCTFNFKVKPEGDKLVGKTGGGRDLTLSRK